jgi:7,8-dihydro-6-hydroxymethylpterin-pyrophosphokinase
MKPVLQLRYSILICCLLLCGCNSFRKSDPVAEADKFLQLIKDDRASEAYDSAAFGFQAQQSLANFRANLHELAFADFVSNKWTRIVPREDEVKLDGEITTHEGGKFEFEVTMARDRGQWRLFSLRTHGAEALPTNNPFTLVGRGAAFQDVANRPVPPEFEVRSLVRETIAQFSDAVRKKNFEDFYNGVSISWQKQVSPKRLMRAFQPFMENKINLDELGVRKVYPVFTTAPTVNGEGLLVAAGVFPTQPYRVSFSFKYTYELPHWKLFGIDVNLLTPQ